MSQKTSIDAFQEFVVMRYQIYNGLFLTLPFANLAEVGAELPVFADLCRTELEHGKSPKEIVETFFKNIAHTEKFDQQIAILLLLLQFVERQIVLLDAIEDAAFIKTHAMNSHYSIGYLLQQLTNKNQLPIAEKILNDFRARIVLTAHPTQFYPRPILGIIQDLSKAVQGYSLKQIRDLLLQLAKTPFRSHHRPTPFEEAEGIIRYLKKSFYPVIKKLHYQLSKSLSANHIFLPAIIELGFWPGGDRDGNPNVTADITLAVATRLRTDILTVYIKELQRLQKRLTFLGVLERLELFEQRVAAMLDQNANQVLPYKCADELIDDLKQVREIVSKDHRHLFIDKIEKLISAVISFGFHFASLDIRQDSRVHTAMLQKLLNLLIGSGQLSKDFSSYEDCTSIEKTKLIKQLLHTEIPSIEIAAFIEIDPLLKDIIQSLKVVNEVQQKNGEKGLHRYIISNTQAAYNLLEIMLFSRFAGWRAHELTLDIVPLFETIQDLENAEMIMDTLYQDTIYQQHLAKRGYQQTIMLGFSDGTKDGGYVTANWEIFKTKKRLAEQAKKYNIKVIFFDGRGGPPARGGGNSYKFYQAMSHEIEQNQIQLTIQGQTISSKFGTQPSATYHIEHLLTAGLRPLLLNEPIKQLTSKDIQLMDKLSQLSYEAYLELKNHPKFLPYLEKITPLNYSSELNIASRPAKRKNSNALVFSDLRAIPFVSAWSQMKQNIPGFYGLGRALTALIQEGHQQELQLLCQQSLFFRALLENAERSLSKSYFPLTHYLENDPEFGSFWQMLSEEAKKTEWALKDISSHLDLANIDVIEYESIRLREDIVLPLWVIQQYALMRLRECESMQKCDKKAIKAFHNLVLKALAANINASRNSA